MKILYASQLSPNDSALYRQWALERLGHTVVPFNLLDYLPRNPLLRKLEHRAQMGPNVSRLNRDLLSLASSEKPDVFWVVSCSACNLRRLKSYARNASPPSAT